MPFVAVHPERYSGRDNFGHCVAFVCAVTGLPPTSAWRRGDPVATTDCASGTAIATFGADGRYENRTDGASHAAIFVGQHEHGMRVWDCWLGEPVKQRTIRWKDGVGKAADDASRYYCIELAGDGDA